MPGPPGTSPLHVNIELTDHCNLRCRMCSQAMRSQAHGSPSGFMDWPTWRAALKGLEDMPGSVHLSPHWLGEPTSHPEFARMVEYAFAVNTGNHLFRHFKLHTNGLLLDKECATLLIRLNRQRCLAPDTFNTVHFSLDAWARRTYLNVKGVDACQRVEDNVLRFLETRHELGAHYPSVHLAFVVQQGNFGDLRPFVDGWGAVLKKLGQDWLLTCDWPPPDRDAIYIRRLNSGQQEQADAMHRRACCELGIAGTNPGPVPRAPESF